MFLAEVDYPGWIPFRQADRKVVNRLRHAQGSIERRSTPCPRINRTAVHATDHSANKVGRFHTLFGQGRRINVFWRALGPDAARANRTTRVQLPP